MNKRYVVGALLVFGIGACRDALVVGNENNPDRDRAFSNATDLRFFTAGLFGVMHQGTLGGSNDGLQTQMFVLSMENTSGLANFAMGPRGGIPRTQITNARGSQGDGSNTHDWFRQHRAARQAALAYSAIQNLTLGSVQEDTRHKAFARLVHGIALGNLSLAYDSASIITENDNPEADAGVMVPLSHYMAVNAAALGYLDSAIALAPTSFATTANLYINGYSLTAANFLALAHSYKAYFRANVARTPAERAAVDWTEVIADANAGITADVVVQFDRTNGWDHSWSAQMFAGAQWHQMSQFWVGMADTTGAYAAWLNVARPSRTPFLVVTPDLRFPQGTTRAPAAATQADSQRAQITTYNSPPSGGASVYNPSNSTTPRYPYLRNRPAGSDVAGEPLQTSMYDFWRTRQMQQASRSGPNARYPVLSAASIRLLAAEGYIRTGDYPSAVTRINVSRTAAGLPAIPLTTLDTLIAIPGGTAALPVIGGSSCVPRVPDAAAGFLATKCGNVWDALKWEYRMEAMYVNYGSWYFPARGWGDLPEGTAIQWAVPNQEMDARGQPFYGMGGVDQTGGAAAGNYGLFAGGVY